MIEKLQTAESALESLQKDLARIEEDLAIKTNSFALDNKCMDSRKKLTDPGYLADKGVDAVTEGVARISATGERASPITGIVDYEGAMPKYADELKSINPNYSQTDAAMRMSGGSKTGHYKDPLETTYGASYEIGRSDLRSGDLARTLGKATKSQRIGSTDKYREVLVD